MIVTFCLIKESHAQLYSNFTNTFTPSGDTRVGIGTSTPTTTLFVKPPTYTTTSHKRSPFHIEFYHNPPPPSGGVTLPLYKSAIFVKWDGLIGVHTNNPLEAFHINATIRGGDINGSLRLRTDDGYVRIGAVSSSFMHFETDLPNFHFNKGMQVDGSILIYNPNGLGTGNNQILLKSDGSIRAREVKVDLDAIPVPDYVFKKEYNLMPLEDLRKFVKEYKHLPNIKSEAEFKEEGSVSLLEMNMKLLEKVEELTLYLLQQEERIEALENSGGVE